MSTIKKFKRGGIFSYGTLVPLASGTTWGVAAQLRDADGNKIADLDATIAPPVSPATTHSVLIVKAATATALWPEALLRGDIKFFDNSNPSVVLYTSTFVVDTIEPQTR
jgi:hypothetical protein